MPELTIMEAVKLGITVDEIIQATREIMKNTKQRKIRTALKQMLRELKKGNKSLVNDIFVPLYNIRSQDDFNQKFPQIHSKFKQFMLEGRPFIAKISCWKISKRLEVLTESQQWKKRIPIINRNVVRMELLTQRWIADDGALYNADHAMMMEINNFLDSVSALAMKNPAIAYKKLKTELKKIEEQFLELRNQLAEIDILSDQLST